MEGRDGLTAGAAAPAVTAPAEAAGSYQPPPQQPPLEAAARSEGPSQAEGGTAAPRPAGVAVGPAAGSVGMGMVKKKRGRPRKYGPDGSLLMPLSPKPISASAPPGEYHPAPGMKRGRGRPGDFVKKPQHAVELESLGEMVACSAGANFTPHVITVAAGEDVTMKIISFSQQGPRAICILSANGIISNVTLRQPDSSGGTLTYEGRFELLSLSGSFMPTDNGGTRSRSGGMSVSLASPDGRVVGGGVAGLLVAASPVQVVVGSFLPGYQMEQKSKKPKLEATSVSFSAATIQIPSSHVEVAYSSGQGTGTSAMPKTTRATTSFRAETWSASIPDDTRNSSADINAS
ncbi:AT-hook motif nuclear-localized protein 1 [Elaeis guineensis]|uniref:AT-hook motif nuclear-localized protein n=1 Tax=Elaeis guineensis var. tenera TaxID=51953 RepID=A0A6I9QB35_ELAGV|nr:AT-hook motif nuclear-localized protein 1 [Elaeis guineensis]